MVQLWTRMTVPKDRHGNAREIRVSPISDTISDASSMVHRESRLGFLLLFLSLFSGYSCTKCYHCVSQIDVKNSESEKTPIAVLRFTLDKLYNVPPAHLLCEKTDDLEFKTISTIDCNGKCVKIDAASGEYNLVMRGCYSTVYKSNVEPARDTVCGVNDGPSLCICAGDRCNNASAISISSLIFAGIAYLFYYC